MKIEITDKIGNPIKAYLEAFKTRFPSYVLTTDKIYNGICVDVDEDDHEDFCEALEAAGFDYETEEVEASGSNAPKWPKFKPIFSKTSPKLPKSKPKLGKVRPVLPKMNRMRIVARPKPFPWKTKGNI